MLNKKISKLLIISDTHGCWDNFMKIYNIEKPDYVIHCGDYDNFNPTDEKNRISIPKEDIKKYFNQYVDGNHGVMSCAKSLEDFCDKYKKNYKIFNLGKNKCFLAHNMEWLDDSMRSTYKILLEFFNETAANNFTIALDNKVNYIFCGHTHQPKIYSFKNMVIVNPGASGKVANATKFSYAIGMLQKDNKYKFEIKYL